MTIHIPDELAHRLARIAAQQNKSVEQLALEHLETSFEGVRSPQAILRAFRDLPHPSASAVDELEAAIAAARLPVCDQDVFKR